MAKKPTYEELEQKVKKLENKDAKHRLTHAALWESEERYRLLVETMNDGLAIQDENRLITYVNDKFCDMVGYQPHELVGRPAIELCDDRNRQILQHQMASRRQGAPAQPYELEITGKDGSQIPVILSPQDRFDSEGRSRGSFAVFTDLTERKRTEERLKEIQELDEKILYGSPVAFVLHDRDLRIVRLSRAYKDVTGYDPDEVFEKSVEDFMPEGRAKALVVEALKRVRDEGVQVGPRDILAPTREEIYLSETILPVFDSTGKVSHILSVLEDITKRRQTEVALRESEAMARTLLQTPTDIAAVLDARGIILDANQTMASRLRKSVDELKGTCVWELFPPGLAKRRKSFTDKVFQSGKPGRVEDYRNGRWFDNVVHPVFDSTGKVSRVALLARDITEMKRKERELKKTEAELKTKGKALEEVNTALRVLLKQREEDKGELEEKVLSNVKDLILPYIERLKKGSLSSNQMSNLSILESNLNDIVSPFARTLSTKYLDLTPTEIRVAHLVRDGKTTKEIAEFMHLSAKTIGFHRDNVRRKLGLTGKKVNLRTQLLSM